MPGEFLSPVGSIQVFEHVLARVQRLPEMDPKTAFRTATPGVIGQLTEQMGPWRGREDVRFEIPGVTQGGRAVGPEERMEVGTDDIGHIVALRGFELAGHSQRVSPEMFSFGGMTQERANSLAAKPILDFNDEVASNIMMNVMTSGDFSGAVADDFQWSATDLSGNSVSQPIITDDADQVPNVYANGTQTFTHWPLRDGTQASAGHDHLFDTGAAWTESSARTQINNVLEHPGNNTPVAYVGSTVASSVVADLKSEFGAIESRTRLVTEGLDLKGDDFAFASPIGERGGVMYFHMVDMPTSAALFVARGKKPFHLNLGAVGAEGGQIGTRAWTERGDPERRGTTYGYRDYVSAGVKDPLAVTFGEFAL